MQRFLWLLRMGLWGSAALIVAAGAAFGVATTILPSCSSCHMVGDFKRDTRAEAHAGVECAGCHVRNDIGSRIAFTTHEVFGMVLHVVPEAGRATAQVDDRTCLTCHAEIRRRVSESEGLRIDHSQCAVGSTCTDCHSATAHGASARWRRQANMEMCLDCHVAKDVRKTCDSCHVGRQSASRRLSVGSWQVTHGPGWLATHGMGDWNTCSACHPAEKCVKCHHIPLPHDGDFIGTHGATALTHRSDCVVCHEGRFCADCHGVEMPHPASFTPSHGRLVQSGGQAVCLKCHVAADCETCHVKHEHPGGVGVPLKGAL